MSTYKPYPQPAGCDVCAGALWVYVRPRHVGGFVYPQVAKCPCWGGSYDQLRALGWTGLPDEHETSFRRLRPDELHGDVS